MAPFLGDVTPTTGALAGSSLADLGIMLQRRPQRRNPPGDPPNEEEPKKDEPTPSPNKPREDWADKAKPSTVNLIWWSEVGTLKPGTGLNADNADPAKELVAVKTEHKQLQVQLDHAGQVKVPVPYFEFMLQYYPGFSDKANLDRTKLVLKKLGHWDDFGPVAGKGCPYYFYTFAQAFKASAVIDGTEVKPKSPEEKVECKYKPGVANLRELPYNVGQWNIDSRHPADGIWEYAGSVRGAGGGRDGSLSGNVKRSFASAFDRLQPGGPGYWAKCGSVDYFKSKQIDIAVEFETYAVLCCSDNDASASKPTPPWDAVPDSDAAKSALRGVAPVAVVGHYYWSWRYQWKRPDPNVTNDHKWDYSRVIEFSKWAWRTDALGQGWAAVQKVSSDLANVTLVKLG